MNFLKKAINLGVSPPKLDMERSILNLTGSKHLDDHLLLKDFFEHILVTGSTGAGKTSTLAYYLVNHLLKAHHLPEKDRVGMVFFLYKTSDLDLFVSWAKKQGREKDIRIVNSTDKDVFNLLNHYQGKEAITAVDALMTISGLSLGGGSKKDSEQYWEQAKRQRLHRLILLNQVSGEELNIHTLHKIHSSAPQMPEQLEDEDWQKTSFCWQMLNKAHENLREDHPQFKLLENYFVREVPFMADRTQSSILSLTSAILEPFINSPMLSNIFCGGTNLDLDGILKGEILILNLPIQQYEYSGKVAQMMFKYILQKKIEARNLNECPNPVILFLDEYQHYINNYDMLFLSTARSSRAGCILMTQNISALFAQMGGTGKAAEEKVNALFALSNHKFFLPQNNYINNEFASKTIGMGIHSLGSGSVDMSQFKASAGHSESYHYIVMPREFSMFRRGGKQHKGIVDAIVTGTGKRFSNGQNYLKLTLKQPWFKS